MCNNHEQDFPSASEQHPSTNNTTYMGKAPVVSVSENESTAKDLSGDGRADSPGHSAKYGSYTVIDISCNKVMDFKLVQV